MNRRGFLKVLATVPILAKALPRLIDVPAIEVPEEIISPQYFCTSTPPMVLSSEDKIYMLEPNASPLSLLLDKKRMKDGEYKFDWSE